MIGFFLNDFFESEIKGFLAFFLFLILVIISLILIAKLSLQKILKVVIYWVGALYGIIRKFYIAQSAKYQELEDEAEG